MRCLPSIALIALLIQHGCIENCTEPNPWATDVLEMTVPDSIVPDMAGPSADLLGVPRCSANLDCPLSGLCLDTQYFDFIEHPGDCVGENRITYVNIDSTNTMPDGTRSSPFHTIAEAFQAVLAGGKHLVEEKPYILVAGSSKPYGDPVGVKLPDIAEVVLIGPWADPALTPTRPAKTNELVYWAKNSMAPATVMAPLLIDGGRVWIDGVSFHGKATDSGIKCIKSERLFIQRTKIESYKLGVSNEYMTNTCPYININRSAISNNIDAGVYVTGRPSRMVYVIISNSSISKNGGPGIVTSYAQSLQVVHSTIVENGKPYMPYGAISFTDGLSGCRICGSLLAGNSSSPADMGSGSSQQNCDNVIVTKEVSRILDAGLAFNSDFLLIDPDSAPMSQNYDFIDKIPGAPCGSASVDYVGTKRPKGESARKNEDYGMHEVWWKNPSDGGLP